jgi:hypothetical protein
LRLIPVHDSVENCGLRRIGVRRSTAEPDVWEIYVSARNYGTAARTVTLALDFGPLRSTARMPVGSQPLRLAAGTDSEATFQYRTSSGGTLGVTLLPHDAFSGDDHAELELPAEPTLPVIVYSNEPDLLRPVLGSMPRVSAVYRKPEEYHAGDSGLVILDRFIPAQRPTTDSIWLDPPVQGSPIPVRTTVTDATFLGWNAVSPGAEGLRAKDFKLDKASVLETGADDKAIGQVSQGPVIAARARPGEPKIVVFGFHPALSGMRYELVTPLLFANLMRWISPGIFYRSEINGGSVGSVKLVIDQDTAPDAVKITAMDGSPVPFTIRERTVNFFSGSPGLVRVLAGDREYRYSLTLPQLWDTKWSAPADVRQGIPRFSRILERSSDVWPWLALAGGAGLLAEWILFGAARREGRRVVHRAGFLLLRRRRTTVEAGR